MHQPLFFGSGHSNDVNKSVGSVVVKKDFRKKKRKIGKNKNGPIFYTRHTKKEINGTK